MGNIATAFRAEGNSASPVVIVGGSRLADTDRDGGVLLMAGSGCPRYNSGNDCNPCSSRLHNGKYTACGFYIAKGLQDRLDKQGVLA